MKRFYLSIFFVLLLVSCGKDTGIDPDGGGVKPEGEVTVRGIIYDNGGNVMPNVVVSDGLNCVKTKSDGRFELASDLTKAKFVFVVQPSGYRSAVEKGRAQYYKRLGEGDAQQINGVYQLRFTLEKIAGDADRFTMVMSGDPQPRARTAGYDKIGYHSLDCSADMWRDMKEYAATVTDRPVYGVVLGDLVHENMSLYKDYLDGIASLDYATYSVIGNHDNDTNAADDDSGAAYFEQNLGPRNYSFNVGRFHVIVLDNLIMKLDGSKKLKEYDQGLTDDIWTWLQNDLRFVDRSTPLIVCSHSPMFRLASGSDRYASSGTKHGADYANLLSKYKKVYAWAGHVHNSFNFVYDDTAEYPNIEVHTVSRSTGALWINEWLCEDGTPRGYVVVDIDGENVEWKFKPVAYQSSTAAGATPSYKYRDFVFTDGVAYRNGKRLDSSYQLRAYPRGAYGDKYVYANVFMYDEKWGQVKFTSESGGTTVMTKVPKASAAEIKNGTAKSYDAAYKEVFDFYKTNNSTLNGNSGFSMSYELPHLFRCYAASESDRGTVTVTDRFGNEYSTTVSW
ncbi:MAG: calcineurin-like phosphoesterase C-terminal domain-containing protein [Alistipes sp.]|nr:calcineurin-like phosphoesterase C-terminal domain-containing protein [Alistipes sp.]